jgi:diguanylate cyclase
MDTRDADSDTAMLRAPSLGDLADILSSAQSTEALVRPLLSLLQVATGLESVYLTSIDHQAGTQSVEFVLNRGEMQVPEGFTVPWTETLCRRAIEEGCEFSSDVSGHWGDYTAARELGIVSYLSTPVRVGEDELYGTLCAASASRHDLPVGSRRLLYLFGKLIALQIEHEQLLTYLRRENMQLSEESLTDPLTGLANRRELLEQLGRRLVSTRHADAPVLMAFIDLDGFKGINDTHGFDAGDRFLIEVAQRLRGGLREEDVVARHGGDEFVVLTGVAHDPGSSDAAAHALRARIESLIEGEYLLGPVQLDYPGASVGVVDCPPGGDRDALLAQAEAAMSARKRERKARHAEPHVP